MNPAYGTYISFTSISFIIITNDSSIVNLEGLKDLKNHRKDLERLFTVAEAKKKHLAESCGRQVDKWLTTVAPWLERIEDDGRLDS